MQDNTKTEELTKQMNEITEQLNSAKEKLAAARNELKRKDELFFFNTELASKGLQLYKSK